LPQLVHWQGIAGRAREKEDVEARTKIRMGRSKNLTEAPPYSVSNNRPTVDFLRNNNRDPRSSSLGFCGPKGKSGV
jgi:hypothetical protein